MNFLRQLFQPRAILKTGLLLVAIHTLASGLANAIDGVQYSALFPVGIFGLFIGWAMTFIKWPNYRSWEFILFSGLVFIFIQVAELWEPMIGLVRNINDAQIQLLRQLLYKTPADFIFLKSSFETLLFKTGELVQHLVNWTRAPSDQDAIALQFIWDIPIFVLAAWSAWALTKHKDALIAFAPLLALLGYILYYTHSHPFPIQIELFILLLLMGINGWERYSPKRRGTRSEEKAATDTGMALFLLAIGLAIFAGLIPSVSAKELVQSVEQNTQKARNEEIAAKLGLKVEKNPMNDPANTYSTPTLPNKHLIGGQPSMSNAVVFTARTGELPPLPANELRESNITFPRHYWRMITYDVYTGNGWATSLTESQQISADQYLFAAIPQGYTLLDQQIQKTSEADARLFWSGHLALVDKPFQTAWRSRPNTLDPLTDPLLGADMLGSITDAANYHAQSLVPNPTEDQLRASSPDYPELIRQKYLSLPETVPDRVSELARELTADQTNPYDKAQALEAYLRTYPYTLDVPPPPTDRDIADHFLFDLKTGYCDYYATSMVVMARSVGLPARLVTGFASGSYVPTTATYIVHGRDAHSWPEIYFDDIGWVEFEPTSSQPEITRPTSPPQEEAEEAPPKTVLENPKPEPGKDFNNLLATYGKPLLTFLIALFGLLGWILYRMRTQRLDTDSPIAYVYNQLFLQGGKLAIQSPIYETPYSFASRLVQRVKDIGRNVLAGKFLSPAQTEIESITSLYVQEVYSPRALTVEDQKQAKKIWKKLYWRLIFARIFRGKNSSCLHLGRRHR